MLNVKVFYKFLCESEVQLLFLQMSFGGKNKQTLLTVILTAVGKSTANV